MSTSAFSPQQSYGNLEFDNSLYGDIFKKYSAGKMPTKVSTLPDGASDWLDEIDATGYNLSEPLYGLNDTSGQFAKAFSSSGEPTMPYSTPESRNYNAFNGTSLDPQIAKLPDSSKQWLNSNMQSGYSDPYDDVVTSSGSQQMQTNQSVADAPVVGSVEWYSANQGNSELLSGNVQDSAFANVVPENGYNNKQTESAFNKDKFNSYVGGGLALGQLGLGVASYLDQSKTNRKNNKLLQQQYETNKDEIAHRNKARSAVGSAFANV